MTPNTATAVDNIVTRLDQRAVAKTKAWWESYLKDEIEFRGVPMAGIRQSVNAWHDEAEPDHEFLEEVALTLLRQPVAEDKLAGILIFQEHLLPAHKTDWRADLAALEPVFDEGHIWDWNTCDWLCVRVLGPLADRNGEPCARAIASWTGAPGLWRRRAGVVAFVNLAARGDDFFEGFVDLLLDASDANTQDPERFSQTSVGWVLRELSDAEPDRVFAFVGAHREQMSKEAIRMAAARLPDRQRVELGVTGKRGRR